MREFIYFSGKARTSGNFDDLMDAGRMDIACHVVINTFFISHKMRQDSKLHLIFYGPPDPPKHLELEPGFVIPGTGRQAGSEKPDMSKKDIAGLIKKMLYKYRPGQKTQVWPGYSVEKKSLFAVLDDLRNEGKEIYILDARGDDIAQADLPENSVFLIGDHDGLPQKELKRLKKQCKTISLGKTVYFASHVVTIINYTLDRKFSS